MGALPRDGCMRAVRVVAAAAVALAAQLCLASGASAVTFNADSASLGAIPDSATTGPAAYGGNRDVTFTVPSGTFTSTSSPTHVAVTFESDHTWVGDLDVVLRAPNGEQATIFSRTGAASGGDFGHGTDLAGPYTFSDRAPAAPTWWAAAGGTPDGRAVPAGSYRTSAAGPGSGSNTSLTVALNNATMNGTWTLRVRDGAGLETGSITSASLELTGTVPATPGFLGAIPDGSGPPLDVLFSVDGLAAEPPSSISTSMTFSPNHTYVGDLEVTLIAPDNTQHTIFSRTGDTTGGNGDSSNLAGPYTFLDGALGSWWTAASNAADADAIAAASYRTSAAGGAGSTGANTLLTPAFAGVPDPNGAWTLRFDDRASGDTGSVSAASLRILSGNDTTAPIAPSLGAATDPPSPSSSTLPKVKGNVEPGSTVRLYANGTCSGLPAATGTAAVFTGSIGIPIPIDNEGPGQISATAYDAFGNVSGCSNAIAYTRDTAAPTTPTLSSTDPASPASDDSPRVKGSTDDLISVDDDVTVKLYGSSDCSDIPAAAIGSETDLEGAGIEVFVPEDDTTSIYATATDEAGNVSGCSPTPVVYTEDSSSPTPTLVATDPASPANENFPKLRGSGAEAGSTIKVYSATDCTPPLGPVLFTGTAAEFNGAGVEIEVLDNTSDPYLVTATDALDNVSGCSGALTYTEDSAAPATPTLSATDPGSGSNQNALKIKGAAEPGSQVKLFTSATCSGSPVATGAAAVLGGAGIGLSVADNSTTQIRATATDAAGNASACSAPITYVEDSQAPQTTATTPKAKVKTKKKSVTVRFSLSATEPNSHFECRLDDDPFAACDAAAAMKLRRGKHTFEAVAIDAAGNRDSSAASVKVKVVRKKRR